VITQVTYSGLAARTAGFSSGVAQSAQLNKVWRQSSIMSAVLAQFISDRTGLDVLDDGTTATILANLKAAAAAVNGDATKTFSVAAATAATHAVSHSQAFTVGQVMTSVIGSRALNTTYTNSTGKAITVEVCVSLAAGQTITMVKGGVSSQTYGNAAGGAVFFSVFSIVLPGQTYQITTTGGTTLTAWNEIR
jgi:hypothetical protein